MSQWTHVASNFRFDSFGRIPDEKIVEIIGKEISFENMLRYDESCEDKILPMGSEGTLEMSIWHNPDKSCMASTSVSVFGDLRDYNSFDELEKWFNEVCKSFLTRQAVMQVYVEGVGSKVFEYID